MAALSGWVAFAVYGEAASSHALDRRVGTLGAQNAVLRTQIAEREREASAGNDPAWLQAEARKLGYVLPGERVFVVTTAGANVPASGGIAGQQLPIYNPPSASGTGRPDAESPPVAAAPVNVSPTSAAPTPHVFTLPKPTH